MKDHIVANYLNGQSSRKIKVEIVFKQDFIELVALNKEEDDFIVDLHWDMNHIENVNYSSSTSLHLHYGDLPKQSLMVHDKSSVNLLKDRLSIYKKDDIHQRVLKIEPIRLVIGSLIAIIAVVSLYLFVVAPVVAERLVSIVPIETEILLGKRLQEPILLAADINEDKSKILLDFYNEIGYKSAYPINCLYDEGSTVNAFAIPGGTIVVYDGLVEKMDNWKELAGLLAHESAHVEYQHSLKTLGRSLSTYIVLSILTSDVSGLFAILVENASKVQNLANSRDFEAEADEKGLELMLENNIDPQGMLDLFSTLEQDIAMPDTMMVKEVMSVLSSHPLTEDRIESITQQINTNKTSDYIENENAIKLFNQLKGEMVND